MVLRCKLDLTGCFKRARLGVRLARFLFPGLILVSLVETDSRFEDQENVVSRTLDLADGLGDAIRIGQRLVYCVAQLLHQIFQMLFHTIPFPRFAIHRKLPYLVDALSREEVALSLKYRPLYSTRFYLTSNPWRISQPS